MNLEVIIPKDIYTIADELLACAKANLEKCAASGDDLCHVAFPVVSSTGRLSIVPLPGEPQKRRMVMGMIHANLEENNCDGLIIITDAWAKPIPEGMSLEEAIKQYDLGLLKPQEALITLVCGRDVAQKAIISSYTRQDKAIVWGEQTVEYNAGESWMIPPQWVRPISGGTA